MTNPVRLQIQSKDFQSLEFNIYLSNTTTHTEIIDGDRVTLVMLEDSKLVLRIPTNAGNIGHMLLIKIIPKAVMLLRKKFSFNEKFEIPNTLEFTAKITSVEDPAEGFQLVALELKQFIEKEWLEFRKSFSDRQSNVNQLMKLIRD